MMRLGLPGLSIGSLRIISAPAVTTESQLVGLGATLWARTDGVAQSMPNLISGGPTPVLVGTTSGVEATDPTLSPHTYHYARLPGVAGNYVIKTANSISCTKARMTWDFGPDGLKAGAALACPGGVWTGSVGVTLYVYTDGSARGLYGKGAATFTDAAASIAGKRFVRLTVDTVANGSTMETSDDGTTWAAYSTGVGIDGTMSATANARVGVLPHTGGSPYEGTIAEMSFEQDDAAGLSFNPAADIDVTSDPEAGQASFNSWTVNRAGSAYQTQIVTRPILGFKASDELTLPVAATNQYVLARTWGGALELKSTVDVEAGVFTGEIVDVLDFGSVLSGGDVATVEGLLL